MQYPKQDHIDAISYSLASSPFPSTSSVPSITQLGTIHYSPSTLTAWLEPSPSTSSIISLTNSQLILTNSDENVDILSTQKKILVKKCREQERELVLYLPRTSGANEEIMAFGYGGCDIPTSVRVSKGVAGPPYVK
jgi:hypothetical protein